MTLQLMKRKKEQVSARLVGGGGCVWVKGGLFMYQWRDLVILFGEKKNQLSTSTMANGLAAMKIVRRTSWMLAEA